MSARTITFAGRTWNVKNGAGKGPGPNNWSDSTSSVWVDADGSLHLKIRRVGSTWYCAEVRTTQPTKHGLHRFKIIGRPDQFDRNIVFAPFLYHDDSHEVDIEFSAWGSPSPALNSLFVVQPAGMPGNHHSYRTILSGNHSTHYFDWLPSSIAFKSFHGHYSEPPDPGYLIDQWTYMGPSNPPDSLGLNIHINLWLVNGQPPSNAEEVEMIVRDIDYPLSSP